MKTNSNYKSWVYVFMKRNVSDTPIRGIISAKNKIEAKKKAWLKEGLSRMQYTLEQCEEKKMAKGGEIDTKLYDFIFEVSGSGKYYLKTFINLEGKGITKTSGESTVNGLNSYHVTESSFKELKK